MPGNYPEMSHSFKWCCSVPHGVINSFGALRQVSGSQQYQKCSLKAFLISSLPYPPRLFLLVKELWGNGTGGLCQAAVHFINRMHCAELKLWPRALSRCWKSELASQLSGRLIPKQILLCLGPVHSPAFQAKIAWSHQKARRKVSMGILFGGYLSLVWERLYIRVKGRVQYVHIECFLTRKLLFFFLNCKAEVKLATNTEYLECIPTYVCVCICKSTSPCLFLLLTVPSNFEMKFLGLSQTALLPNHRALIYASRKSIWFD